MLPWLSTPASPELLSGLRDTSLSTLVRDEVLALILRGELEPGQRINEPDVAARLRVSRVPVREALRQLESSGLVAARKHAGVFVRTLTRQEIADLYDLRSALDGHAGVHVARLPAKARQALVTQLNALVKTMRVNAREHDVQAYYRHNLALHWAIVEGAGNQALANTYQGIVQQLHLSRLKNLSHDLGMKASMAEHEQIVEALSSGDEDRSRALLSTHVTTSYDRLVEKLDDPTTPGDNR